MSFPRVAVRSSDRRTSWGVAALVALAAACALAGLWIAFDNPTIDGTSRGAGYTCLAPWDTVLNGADNVPGGEPPADIDAIAARCRDAGRARFAWAVVGGVSAAVAAAGALGLARRGTDTSG